MFGPTNAEIHNGAMNYLAHKQARKEATVTNPIPVPMEDELIHTAANGYTCGQPDCPCSAEVEDEIILTPPTEEQLDAQEQSVLGPRRIDWNRIFEDGTRCREADQERNITHQCADGSWW